MSVTLLFLQVRHRFYGRHLINTGVRSSTLLLCESFGNANISFPLRFHWPLPACRMEPCGALSTSRGCGDLPGSFSPLTSSCTLSLSVLSHCSFPTCCTQLKVLTVSGTEKSCGKIMRGKTDKEGARRGSSFHTGWEKQVISSSTGKWSQCDELSSVKAESRRKTTRV